MQVTAATKDVQRRLDAGRPDQAHRRPRRRARIRGPRPAEVREHWLRGEKIRAIKPHRDATGSDPTSAKEAVDRIEATGAQDTPS